MRDAGIWQQLAFRRSTGVDLRNLCVAGGEVIIRVDHDFAGEQSERDVAIGVKPDRHDNEVSEDRGTAP